jgi:hypothetical protein
MFDDTSYKIQESRNKIQDTRIKLQESRVVRSANGETNQLLPARQKQRWQFRLLS